MLPELLDQIPADVGIGSVTADGAYDTRKCHDAIADSGANAAIPPRKNAKLWKPSRAGAVARNEALRASKYLRRGHLAKVKRIPPPKPRRDEDALREAAGAEPHGTRLRCQVAELQVRAAVLNGYTALGVPVTEPVG